jgi:hypothetical protein
MNTINFIIVVSNVLLSTDLIYHQVVNGQSQQLTPEQGLEREVKRCTIYSDSKLVVVNLDTRPPCTSPLTAIAYYSGQGYEIKAVISNSMYMQKLP